MWHLFIQWVQSDEIFFRVVEILLSVLCLFGVHNFVFRFYCSSAIISYAQTHHTLCYDLNMRVSGMFVRMM